MFFMTSSKKIVSYFYNHNKKLYNKFKFLKNYLFIFLKIVLEPCYNFYKFNKYFLN